MTESWPIAHLGVVARLRVLAAGLPGAAMQERVLATPFEEVWDFFSDMERSLPLIDRTVGEFRIEERQGSRLVARARTPGLRLPLTFDVDLEPGWCWMTARPRLYVVGFAAEPHGEQTLLAHLEACTPSRPRWLAGPVQPLLRVVGWTLMRHVVHDIDGIAVATARARHQ